MKTAALTKSATAFRTISEVSTELDVPQHVLRFWETRFPQIRPLKRGGGRRYYRPEDVDLLRRIQSLLYKEGYTIKGVQRLLRHPRGLGDAPDAPDDLTDDGDDEDFRRVPAPEPEDEEGALETAGLELEGAEPHGLPDDTRAQLESILDELKAIRALLPR